MDISWAGLGAPSWRCRRSRRWRSPSSRNVRPIRWCSRWSRAPQPWPLSPSSRYVRPKRRVDLTEPAGRRAARSDWSGAAELDVLALIGIEIAVVEVVRILIVVFIFAGAVVERAVVAIAGAATT